MAVEYSASISFLDKKRQTSTTSVPCQDQSSATYDGVSPYETVRAAWESSLTAITLLTAADRVKKHQSEFISATLPASSAARREAKLVHYFQNSAGTIKKISTPGPDYSKVVYNTGSDEVNIALTVAAGLPLDVFHTNTAKMLNGNALDDYAIVKVVDVGRNT